MKVVFHINELEEWLEAGKNVKNLIKTSPETTVAASVNGITIAGYLDPASTEFLDPQEVVFHVCANAMYANHISEGSLPEQVIVVSAGVLDLVELQPQGYAYIKPQSIEVATGVISSKKFRFIFRKSYSWKAMNQRLRKHCPASSNKNSQIKITPHIFRLVGLIIADAGF